MTITVLMGDGTRKVVNDAQTAASLFVQGGVIVWPDGNVYQPVQLAGAGSSPDGWLIGGVSASDYFAVPAGPQVPAPAPSLAPAVMPVVVNTGPTVAPPDQPVAVPTPVVHYYPAPMATDTAPTSVQAWGSLNLTSTEMLLLAVGALWFLFWRK